MQLPQLKRIRWAVRAALILGVAASVAANILHARQDPIAQAISAWPPLALLLTVELTSRIPMHKRSLAAVRVLATVAIAGIAAWVSYWHMQGVAFRYGETGTCSYLLPISVDGLIVVASVSLVELAGRVRQLEELRLKAAMPAAAPAPVQFVQPHRPAGQRTGLPAAAPARAGIPPAPAELATSRRATTRPTRPTTTTARLRSARPSAVARTDDRRRAGEPNHRSHAPGRPRPTRDGSANGSANGGSVNGSVARAAVSTPTRTVVTARDRVGSTPRQRRPVQETADLAAEIEAMQPDITPAELARRLGISEIRLRTIRREAAMATATD